MGSAELSAGPYTSRHDNAGSLKPLDLKLGNSTLFIGQNNASKTAFPNAVRIALTRRSGERGMGFTE
jgi:putative ATP-dependent endonuclease of the OLD family